jgi:sRNA-binding protein
MSNGSLKEQLEALALASTEVKNSADGKVKPTKHPARHPAREKNAAKQKPAWLEYAQYGVELLKAHFPQCFKDIKETQPLKIGIKQDLVKALGTREDIVIGDKACMVTSLAYYVNSLAYLKNMVVGTVRIDLEGKPAGMVTAEESQYSIDSRKAKLLKKKSVATAKEPEPANN